MILANQKVSHGLQERIHQKSEHVRGIPVMATENLESPRSQATVPHKFTGIPLCAWFQADPGLECVGAALGRRSHVLTHTMMFFVLELSS